MQLLIFLVHIGGTYTAIQSYIATYVNMVQVHALVKNIPFQINQVQMCRRRTL